jgi:hypothetical protein
MNPPGKIAVIGASALAAILLIGLTGGALLLSRRQTLASPDDEISSVVSVVNARLTDVSLEPSHLILEGAARPRAQYMLTLGKQGPSAIYLFQMYEYTFETGGDEEKIPTAKLCDLVEAVYDRPEPIFESLRQIKVEGKVSFPIWKGISADLQTNLTAILVQMLYAIRKFHELQHTYPEILIRGYADGKTTNWSRPILGGNYHFTSIKAFFPTDRISFNPIAYNSYEETISLESGQYTNEHLPDLRAKFVEQDLVTPYLNDCKEKRNTQVHIIKGYEFKTPDQPLERKVQIHILLRDVSTSNR